MKPQNRETVKPQNRKTVKYIILLLSFSALSTFTFSQGSNLPLGNPAYHILDRLEIKTGMPAPYHSALKYYGRGHATAYAMAIDTSWDVSLSMQDRFDLYYIFKDNNEWLASSPFATTLGGPKQLAGSETGLTQVEASRENSRYTLSQKPVLKWFYQTPANLFEVNEKYFHLRVNPIVNFKMYKTKDDKQQVFTNQRGVDFRGGIDDRIYFQMNILETQSRFPEYVNQWIKDYNNTLPGAGLFKSYQSDIFNINRGYDYLNGQGYLAFNITRHVGMQFGYGRQFIGNGYRSLLLSDFANNNLYLKLNWQVGKFHLQNLFTELTARSNGRGGEVLPRKYMAAHFFNYKLRPNLSVGVFETVVFSRPDHFEFQYLNPIILYRTIEHSLGSPDNVLIGLNANWNFLKHFQLYGQLIMDEFVFDELFIERRGWWGNKFGFQLGGKYIDAFGIDHLDLQVEYNSVRPYTFTHYDSVANYVHYDQPLAHPLGANFRETLFQLRYQPKRKWLIETRLIRATQGLDNNKTNWGSDLLQTYNTREQDYGNEIGQGIEATTLLFGLDLSYQLFHNVFLEAEYFYRRRNSDDSTLEQQTQYFGGGVRMNIARQRMDF